MIVVWWSSNWHAREPNDKIGLTGCDPTIAADSLFYKLAFRSGAVGVDDSWLALDRLYANLDGMFGDGAVLSAEVSGASALHGMAPGVRPGHSILHVHAVHAVSAHL